MPKIIGNTVGVPNPQPDWSQTDQTKANYIKNKPETVTIIDETSSDEQYPTAKAVYNLVESIDVSGGTFLDDGLNSTALDFLVPILEEGVYNADVSEKMDELKDFAATSSGGSTVVDQTYNPESENPQSGIAVAQAIASIGGSGIGTGSGVSEAQKQTLLAIVNAIGLFNVENAQTLLDNFNKAWDTVEPVPAASITLDKTELIFTAEDTQTLTATVLPSNTTDVVVWTSSNNAVATVKNGVVTPLNDGETVITATAGNASATCAVTVNMFGEIENPVFMSMGKIDKTSTATSDPFTDENYPQTVTFSAVPVKKGTILTFKTNIYNPQNWVRFYNYDTDGLNVQQIWFSDTENTMTTATQDGYIRVVFMRQTDPVIIESDIAEFSTTTDGEKTTYTIVDRR